MKRDKRWAILLELLLNIISKSNVYSKDTAEILQKLIKEVSQ